MSEPMITMIGPLGGTLQIEGITYKPTAAGVYTIPQRIEAFAQAMGLQNRTGAGAPTAADIPNGSSKVWKNTGDGTVKLYYNDGGTLKSVTLS
jgi:hypothetical protein